MPHTTGHSRRPASKSLALGATLLFVGCGEEPTTPNSPGAGAVPAVPTTPEFAATSVGSWSEKAPLPTARNDMAAAVVRNAAGRTILYTIGGISNDLDNSFARAEAYDPVSNTWSTRADMPYKASLLNGAGVINGVLYVSGGLKCDVCGTTDALVAYNPGTNTWTLKPRLPIQSANGVTGVIDGKLYVLTGFNAVGCCLDFDYVFTHKLYRYNPTANTWTRLTSSPHRHAGGAAGVIDGKFYVAGPGTSNGLDVYDPATDTWTSRAPAPSGVNRAGVVLNKKLFVIGGGEFGRDVFAFDPATNSWTTKASLPVSTRGLSGGKVKTAAGQWQIVVTEGGGADWEDGELGRTFAYTPAAPSAFFGSSCSGLNCRFADRSKNGDGTIVAWGWTFGDGVTSSARNPAHAYPAGGTYKVVLKVTDNLGSTGSISHGVTVP